MFQLKISLTKKRSKEIRFDGHVFFFISSIQFVHYALRENLSNRSCGVQIPRDISARFGRYLYTTKYDWTINTPYSLVSHIIRADNLRVA